MENKNPFDEVFEAKMEEKESSFSKKESFPHEKYKTVRINPKDYKKLKKYVFENEVTMVDAISLAVKSLNVELDD